MEGVLWKWTNYWTGWQPRWFILDDSGVLVYYKSQEEVHQGCKGSLKISACEISVHPADPLRVDVTLPGEQHFYLRASTSHERQQWLVALGSAKACDRITKDSCEPIIHIEDKTDFSLKTKRSELRLYCDLLMQQVHSVKDASSQSPPDVQKLDESTQLLSATCDTFISTLEDCLRLARAEFNSNQHSPSYTNGLH